jgi:hypothetical protein
MNCKICDSSRVKKIREIKSPINGLFYSFYACRDCESYFFNLHEHDSDLDKIYEQYAEESTFGVEFKPSLYWQRQVDMIKKLATQRYK